MESPLCRPDTRLIETFGWDGARFLRLEAHLARARASAQALGFVWDRASIDAALAPITGKDPLRVRLTVGRKGDAEVTTGPLTANPTLWHVAISEARLCSFDLLLRHKTTERVLYDQTRAALPAGVDEVLFVNERDEVCEGTITNLFIERGGRLLTPPLSSGCLPGILRAELLASGRADETVLTLADLAGAEIRMGNALRGLIPARLAD